MNIAEVRTELQKLRADAEHDHVLEVYLRVLAVLDQAKALKADADEWLKDWMETNEQELVFVHSPGQVSPEDKRWYVKPDRKVRPAKSTAETLDALLSLTGGDIATVADAMSSNPFKQGTVKKVFGEDFWREHYRVDEIMQVKEGKPTGEQRKVLAQEVVAFMPPERRKRFKERQKEAANG